MRRPGDFAARTDVRVVRLRHLVRRDLRPGVSSLARAFSRPQHFFLAQAFIKSSFRRWLGCRPPSRGRRENWRRRHRPHKQTYSCSWGANSDNDFGKPHVREKQVRATSEKYKLNGEVWRDCGASGEKKKRHISLPNHLRVLGNENAARRVRDM